jgi:hypothetical protein
VGVETTEEGEMMKFVCDPVKYKARYKWTKVDGVAADWNDGNPTHGVYWREMWRTDEATRLNFVLIAVPEKGYYLTPNEPDTHPRINVGPYPDLPTVKCVAETLIELKQEPVWKYSRRKK